MKHIVEAATERLKPSKVTTQKFDELIFLSTAAGLDLGKVQSIVENTIKSLNKSATKCKIRLYKGSLFVSGYSEGGLGRNTVSKVQKALLGMSQDYVEKLKPYVSIDTLDDGTQQVDLTFKSTPFSAKHPAFQTFIKTTCKSIKAYLEFIKDNPRDYSILVEVYLDKPQPKSRLVQAFSTEIKYTLKGADLFD